MPFRIDEDILLSHNVTYFLLHQKENEAIFVPSGWYHQVLNVQDTISINHNWFNGTNVREIWKNLAEQMGKVLQEIDDCRSMDNFYQHCQTMLKADFGMNYKDFIDLLEFIVNSRIRILDRDNNGNNKDSHKMEEGYDENRNLHIGRCNDYHLQEDLRSVHVVILDILEDIGILEDQQLLERCLRLKTLSTAN